MMVYGAFVREQPHESAFGFGINFFSCFGQTFFISLFVPAILADLGLAAGTFGTLYATATITGGLLITKAGARYDTTPLKHYAAVTVGRLGVACALLAGALNAASLLVALMGLRLCGQGLMSHIAITTMEKSFHARRGVALSLAALGYTGAELVLPATVGNLPVLAA